MAVGPTPGQTGTFNLQTDRIDFTGSKIVTQRGDKYGEDTIRGLRYSVSDQAVGVAVPAALSTTSLISGFNPANSKTRVRIQKVSINYFSGTLGQGVFYHCCNNTANLAQPTGGTSLTPTNLDIGNLGTGQSKWGTATTVVSPVVLYPLGEEGAAVVTGTNFPQGGIFEDVDGSIILEPGTAYQIQFVGGAGTTPKVSVGVVYCEEPIP